MDSEEVDKLRTQVVTLEKTASDAEFVAMETKKQLSVQQTKTSELEAQLVCFSINEK